MVQFPLYPLVAQLHMHPASPRSGFLLFVLLFVEVPALVYKISSKVLL